MSKKRVPKQNKNSLSSIPKQDGQSNQNIPHQYPSRYLQERPRWTFSSASKSIFPLPFGENQNNDLRLIISKLQSFEGMTIKEMLETKCTEKSFLLAKYKLKDCAKNLDKSCRDYLDKFHGDYGEIYRFRLDNTHRLYALRNENAFALLWWDRNHEVYKSQ